MTAGQEQEQVPQRAQVTAEPGSRLESLLSAYPVLRAAAEEAEARFTACKDAIKAEACARHPGIPGILVSGAPGLPQLNVVWHKSWHLNTARMKAEEPMAYVRFAEQRGRWELREAI